jgi:heme-degrading monooxygenase HmoA
MWARVSTFQGAAGLSDVEVQDITARATEKLLPGLRQVTGWQGVLNLIDRTTGKSLTITLWDTEDDMRASEEAASQIRAQAAEISREEVQGVERYEVAYQEMK